MIAGRDIERTEQTPVRAARPKGGLDAASLIGLVAAIGVIAAAMVSGGSIGSFVDPPSLLIVVGGTFAVTVASFSLSDAARAWTQACGVLILPTRDPRSVAKQVLLLAEAARRGGADCLKTALPDLRHDPFAFRAVSLITEGLPADDVERILTGEVEASGAVRFRSAAVLRRGAEVSPAMGLIGTLVGLVQMLGGLENPATIGPAMALALLTTLYGAVLGNVVLAPLAAKLERAGDDDALIKTLYTIAAVSIARQENTRRLEMLLNAALPPGKRVNLSERQSPRGA